MVESDIELDKMKVLNQAKILFESFGLKKTSMLEIANSLGMTKDEIEKLFPDKNILIEALVAYKIKDTRLMLQDWIDFGTTEIPQLQLFYRFVVSVITSNRILILNIKRHHPNAFENIQHYKMELIDLFSYLLMKGQFIGKYKKSLNTRMIAERQFMDFKDIFIYHNDTSTVRRKYEQVFDNLLIDLLDGNVKNTDDSIRTCQNSTLV